MDVAVFLAIALGVTCGVLIASVSSKALVSRLGKSSVAPRVVSICAVVSLLLMLVPAMFFSFAIGGNLGGGWGKAASTALGFGSVGVPIGLALGIAICLGGGLFLGAFIGGLFGRVLIYAFSKHAQP